MESSRRGMKRLIFIVILLVAVIVSFTLGLWRAQYLQARFDLAATASTEAKLRASQCEAVRKDNAVRLRGAYLTIVSLPQFMSWFQPGTSIKDSQKHTERASIIHHVLLERFKEDIPQGEIEAVLQRHLSKTESI